MLKMYLERSKLGFKDLALILDKGLSLPYCRKAALTNIRTVV